VAARAPEDRFQVVAELYAGTELRVCRAIRRSDGTRVLVKILNAQYPAPAQIARFEREFALLRRLAGPGIPAALDLQTSGHSRSIVFADQGTDSLAHQPLPLPLGPFFALARKLTAILGRVHAARVLHKDITPANIVCHPSRPLVQLVDFGLAAELPREQHAANRPALLEGTLHIYAVNNGPDQTNSEPSACRRRHGEGRLGCWLKWPKR
jgi:serine/threonine protein kinase